MPKKSTRKKYFWRLLLLFAALFILWERYPLFFRDMVNPIVSTINFSKFSNSEVSWESPGPGIETCTLAWKNDETTFATNVFLLRFDPELIQTRILYQKRLTTAKEIAESEGAFAVINASFFDPEGRPLGLIVREKQLVQRMPRQGMLSSGIFCLKNNRPYIFHRSTFTMPGVSEAIQSFPRLIHDGSPTQQIRNKNEVKPRSGIAVDYNGNIIIYATDTHFGGLSLNDLQNLLLTPRLNIRSALNLDGGRSSQLYFNYNHTSKHITGLSEVPLFLGFFEKQEK
ncbi:phosphodiester glycosidase family protein [candidate division KSB1 bacterium]|nr:phosphodiester glycosidase family protein [candidate division KSB1 bacterium]MBL7092341.1 phosphodiester glycosidase family protein [candidate division KSB1 bacterium]